MGIFLADQPERELQLSEVTGRCIPCGGSGKRDGFPVCPDCEGTGADRAAVKAALALAIYSGGDLHNFICLFHGNAWDVSLDLAYNALKLDPENPIVVANGPARPFMSRKFEFVNLKGKQVMQETRWLYFVGVEEDASGELVGRPFEHSPKPLLHYRSDTEDSWHSYTIPEPINSARSTPAI